MAICSLLTISGKRGCLPMGMRISALNAHESAESKRIPGWGGGNPELAKFQPRELIEELRARGYTGTLKITKEINL